MSMLKPARIGRYVGIIYVDRYENEDVGWVEGGVMDEVKES